MSQRNFTLMASRRIRSSPRGLKHARTTPAAPLLLLLVRPATALGDPLFDNYNGSGAEQSYTQLNSCESTQMFLFQEWGGFTSAGNRGLGQS